MSVGATLAVTGGNFACNSRAMALTGLPWTITISGSSSVIGGNTAYRATLDRINFDIDTIGAFFGNLTTGITALQPNPSTSPISINFAGAGGWAAGSAIASLLIDSSYTLTGTSAGWSLTN